MECDSETFLWAATQAEPVRSAARGMEARLVPLDRAHRPRSGLPGRLQSVPSVETGTTVHFGMVRADRPSAASVGGA